MPNSLYKIIHEGHNSKISMEKAIKQHMDKITRLHEIIPKMLVLVLNYRNKLLFYNIDLRKTLELKKKLIIIWEKQLEGLNIKDPNFMKNLLNISDHLHKDNLDISLYLINLLIRKGFDLDQIKDDMGLSLSYYKKIIDNIAAESIPWTKQYIDNFKRYIKCSNEYKKILNDPNADLEQAINLLFNNNIQDDKTVITNNTVDTTIIDLSEAQSNTSEASPPNIYPVNVNRTSLVEIAKSTKTSDTNGAVNSINSLGSKIKLFFTSLLSSKKTFFVFLLIIYCFYYYYGIYITLSIYKSTLAIYFFFLSCLLNSINLNINSEKKLDKIISDLISSIIKDPFFCFLYFIVIPLCLVFFVKKSFFDTIYIEMGIPYIICMWISYLVFLIPGHIIMDIFKNIYFKKSYSWKILRKGLNNIYPKRTNTRFIYIFFIWIILHILK